MEFFYSFDNQNAHNDEKIILNIFRLGNYLYLKEGWIYIFYWVHMNYIFSQKFLAFLFLFRVFSSILIFNLFSFHHNSHFFILESYIHDFLELSFFYEIFFHSFDDNYLMFFWLILQIKLENSFHLYQSLPPAFITNSSHMINLLAELIEHLNIINSLIQHQSLYFLLFLLGI